MNVQSNTKKEKILKATMELIAEKGLHNTPMSLVSKKAGVSAGAIYHHFSSKEELINELYLELKRDIMTVAFQNYNIQDPYDQRFKLIWLNSFNYFVKNPLILSFMEQCSTSPVISEDAKEKANQYFTPMLEFTTTGMQTGILKEMDIMLAISLIWGSIASVARLQLTGKLEITEEISNIAAQSCWDGLKK